MQLPYLADTTAFSRYFFPRKWKHRPVCVRIHSTINKKEKQMLSKRQKFYLITFSFLLMKICRENRRFSTEGKIVSKYCNVSKLIKTQGRSINPHPLYTPVGLSLYVYVRGSNKNTNHGAWECVTSKTLGLIHLF